jgi:hypothetical protein
MNLQRSIVVACSLIAISCGSSGGTDPGGGGTNPPACVPGGGTVCLVSGNQFSPGQITVAPGGSVNFTNISGTTHNVTFTTTGAPANVPDFSSGTRAVAFPTAGSYAYHCTIHGLSMSGVVLVQ